MIANMKKHAIFLCIMLCLSASCDDGGAGIEFDGEDTGQEMAEGDVSIAYLRSLYKQYNTLIDSELYITGRVVSSDQYGAFYKNIVIEDATGGINLRVDMDNYYRVYLQGVRVRVACNSLTISDYGGEIRLGYGAGYISNSMLPSTIIALESQTEKPIPATLTIGQITPENINCLVRIDGVQFEEMGAMWCDMELEAGTDRHLIDKKGDRLVVRTNPNVTFRNALLPTGSGYIEGILGVFNGVYQLQIWSNRYLDMESERF